MPFSDSEKGGSKKHRLLIFFSNSIFFNFFFCRGGSGDAETGETAARENKSAASVSRGAAARESAGR